MKIVVCTGPGYQHEKMEWAAFTGVPVLQETALDARFLDLESTLEALEASGNQRCIVVPKSPLTESQLAEYVDTWGPRVQFQWFHLPAPQPEGNQDA